MSRWFRLALSFVPLIASLAGPRVVRADTPRTLNFRIDKPNVKAPTTQYKNVKFEPGDRVTIDAGGCVQTGGSGRTVHRYVDAIKFNPGRRPGQGAGDNSEKYYSGTVSIQGITDGHRRIADLLGKVHQIPSHMHLGDPYLNLGYQDDNYSDNAFDHGDDGVGDQCKGVGPAWVTVKIERGLPELTVPSPRYNEVYQRSSHNSYDTDKGSIYKQLSEQKLRSIEIDLNGFKAGSSGAALVRLKMAVAAGGGAGANLPVYDGFPHYDSSCANLPRCLEQIAKFHSEQPKHDVLTVFLDIKLGFGDDAPDGATFDKDILAKIGRSSIFTPGDLLAPCKKTHPDATLLGAVTLDGCRWPKLEDMHGKILFVMTSDGGIPGNDHHGYFSEKDADKVAVERLCFIAPGADVKRSYAVFFNLAMQNNQHILYGAEIAASNRISRVWSNQGGLIDTSPGVDSVDRWQAAVNTHIHHIATDKLDESWTRTINDKGWPFRCTERDCQGDSF